MSRTMLVKVTGPTVIIGVLMLTACLVSAWYITEMQANMNSIVQENVSSLEAAQQLEISLRQLRFHCFLYLMSRGKLSSKEIVEGEATFEKWLAQARTVAHAGQEKALVAQIQEGYDRYRNEFADLKKLVFEKGHTPGYTELAQQNPVQHVIAPCRDLLELNERLMNETAQESASLSNRLYLAMVLLGVGGPLAGLISGFGIARGLTRSLHQLSVRVQGMTEQLEQDVGSVSLQANGDIGHLDRQLEHVVGAVEEVALRLQRQQRELLRAQQLSAVGQLAACVAHEIRNPLTAVKMLVEVALRQRNPQALTEDDLRVIHAEVVRLEQTVQNLLDFARLPAPQRQACDVGEVVNQAGELVRTRARQQGVEMVTRCPGAPVVADADRGQLVTVLVNLYLNALDAMAQGGRLETELDTGLGGEVRVRVIDSGGGIAGALMPELFSPFVSNKSSGTGLGLSISQKIVQEHGGAISARNRPAAEGGGACFQITLPVSASADAQQEQPLADLADRR